LAGIELPVGSLALLDPIGGYYWEDEAGNSYNSPTPPAYFDAARSLFLSSDGFEAPFVNEAARTECENANTGPYRRVLTSQNINAIGGRATFYLPPVYYGMSQYINIDPAERRGDTPHIYFGIDEWNAGQIIRVIEAGVMFHPAGRYNLNYNRWQPFLVVKGTSQPIVPALTCFFSGNCLTKHIRYEDTLGGGILVYIEVRCDIKKRAVYIVVQPFDAMDFSPLTITAFFAAAPVRVETQKMVKRVHSIAQKLQQAEHRDGYGRSGGFIRSVGVGYMPLIYGIDVEPPAEVFYNNAWRPWIPSITGQDCVFPRNVYPPVFTINLRAAYQREVISIELRR